MSREIIFDSFKGAKDTLLLFVEFFFYLTLTLYMDMLHIFVK